MANVMYKSLSPGMKNVVFSVSALSSIFGGDICNKCVLEEQISLSDWIRKNTYLQAMEEHPLNANKSTTSECLLLVYTSVLYIGLK